MSRVVKQSTVKGVFGLPMGIRFLSKEIGDYPNMVEVSTVGLEGGHLEDPLGICEAEHGFETMVFLDGCTFFSIHTAKYKTRQEAVRGHRSIVGKLLTGKLPLAIPLGYYSAWEQETKAAA